MPTHLRALLAAALLAAAPLLVAADAVAQAPAVAPAPEGSAALAGVVRDAAGDPIAYANVVRADGRGTIADETGSFRIPGLREGKHRFSVRRIGYEPLEFEVDLVDSLAVHLAIRLQRLPVRLREVTVTEKMASMNLTKVGFYDRQRQGLGEYVLLADIQARNPRHVGDVLRDVRGVHVTENNRSALALGRAFGLDCFLTIWLDGAVYNPGPEGLYALPTTAIAAVEVYPSVTSTPAQFRTVGQRCGSLVLWTRID